MWLRLWVSFTWVSFYSFSVFESLVSSAQWYQKPLFASRCCPFTTKKKYPLFRVLSSLYLILFFSQQSFWFTFSSAILLRFGSFSFPLVSSKYFFSNVYFSGTITNFESGILWAVCITWYFSRFFYLDYYWVVLLYFSIVLILELTFLFPHPRFLLVTIFKYFEFSQNL